VKRIKASHRSGWYLRVLREGYAEAGMSIERIEHPFPEWTIARLHEVMTHRSKRKEEARELASIEALEPKWRKKLADAANS
jgi:MOSC domain-containing protein YiiM